MFSSWSRRTKWLACLLATAALVVVIVLAVELQPPEKGSLGAIATDAAPCQEVGERLMRAGGNAVDVTIGIMFCEGVSSAQSMGLGGGFIMTIYDRKEKKAHVLDSRETAPAAANRDMFGDNKNDASLYSPLGIAIPAELAGYHEAYTKFGGKLTWAQIVEPTIQICQDGVPIIQYVDNILKNKEKRIRSSETLSAELVDPITGKLKKKGDLWKRPKLAATLGVIAKEGGRALHNGSLTEQFVADLKAFNSTVTADDLRKYEPRWLQPTVAELPHGLRLYAPPPPGSGPLLAHFLMLTADLVRQPLDALQYHRLAEAMKFVYAARSEFGDVNNTIAQKLEELVDQNYVNGIISKINDNHTNNDPKYYGASWSATDPKGTAHVSVITEDLAVSVTSTVNTEYGCMLVSQSTGIILNNEMDDFSLPGVNSYYGVPPSENNFIGPGKRPQSSMSPSVIVDKDGDVRLVIGASGGTRITSSAGLVALYHLYLGIDLDEAIRMKRIHHQLAPNVIQCETGFSQELMKEFRQYGHLTKNISRTSSSVMAISVQGNKYYPSADKRREGVIALI